MWNSRLLRFVALCSIALVYRLRPRSRRRVPPSTTSKRKPSLPSTPCSFDQLGRSVSFRYGALLSLAIPTAPAAQ